MRDEQTIETESTELLRTLIRNGCVNTGEASSGHEARSEGTFFVWFRLPEGVTVERLLAEQRAAVAPGEGFGARGAGWARLSLAINDELLDRGLERLRAAFA